MTWKITGRTWTPSQISTALWLDAADSSTITLNGSTVSQWNDKSGNGRHATQTTAANQPTYSVAALNGKSSIVWPLSANPQHLVTTTELTSQEVYFALRYGDGTQTQWIASYQGVFGGVAGFIGLIGDTTGNGLWYNFCDFQGMRRNGVTQPNLGNSIQALPLPSSIIVSSRPAGPLTSIITIGMDRGLSSLNRGWSGAIGEIIALSSIATDNIRQRLEGYLAWKWGLAANLPDTHPFKTFPPSI